jgi:hypothetical protein
LGEQRGISDISRKVPQKNVPSEEYQTVEKLKDQPAPNFRIRKKLPAKEQNLEPVGQLKY